MVNRRQKVFREWTTGTLLYAVVMGFFDDYTEFLDVTSFSTLFLAAFVMQALTYGTLQLKRLAVSRFTGSSVGVGSKVATGFTVWAIMFLSKFVFLAVLDILFGPSVQVSGFLGLVLIIVTMVVVDTLLDAVDRLIADQPNEPG